MNDSAHILLVDDEPRFCESLSQILSLSGFQVKVALNGAEAVELLGKNTFNLLLLDVELPDMLGYQLMDCLEGKNSEAVTIMLTGNATVETAIEALKRGAYDYLKKPVDHDLLFNTISNALKHNLLQAALKTSEERSKALAEASWEGVVVYHNGLLLDANKQFYDMFAYQPDELQGERVIEKIFSTTSRPDLSLMIQNETFNCYQAQGIRKDGTTFPTETICRAIEYQGKDAYVCAIRDISERVKADQEKLELQKKLAIASKMETLGVMAGSVAHDLNNILSGIVTLPELLLAQMGDENQYTETLKSIKEAGKEAASVVSDLITVARGATAKKKVCNLNTVIENYTTTIQGSAGDSRLDGITLKVDCKSELENSYCSVVHIHKVLMNLIGNAAEELKGKGNIVVSTKSTTVDKPFSGYETIDTGRYIVVSVSDDGPGIKEGDIKKIFEPFYSKKIMGRSGTGLGLAIVWNTLHDHGGFIDLKSSNDGTTFELYFPATTDTIAEEKGMLSVEAFRGHGEKILVVDDQEKQQQITCNLLNTIGYKANSVGSGEEAIAYVNEQPVDLLILDMIMENGINGRETYEEILKFNSKQRAIVASGFAENEEVKRTLHLGANQFVKKPYTIIQMGLAVKQALL